MEEEEEEKQEKQEEEEWSESLFPRLLSRKAFVFRHLFFCQVRGGEGRRRGNNRRDINRMVPGIRVIVVLAAFSFFWTLFSTFIFFVLSFCCSIKQFFFWGGGEGESNKTLLEKSFVSPIIFFSYREDWPKVSLKTLLLCK